MRAPGLSQPSGIGKFVRFCITGGLTTVVHVMVVMMCVHALGFAPVTANGTAFVVANLLSYLVHTYWSFSDAPAVQNLRRFIVVSLGGLGCAVLVAWAVQVAGWHYLYGTGLTILVLPIVSFLMHNFWTYR